MVNLTRQYRMNADIMSLSNTLVYGDLLRSGDETIGRRLLTLPCAPTASVPADWIRDVMDPKSVSSRGLWACRKMEGLIALSAYRRSVLFVDTDSLPARERRDGSLIDNPIEAELVQKVRQIAPSDRGRGLILVFYT